MGCKGRIVVAVLGVEHQRETQKLCLQRCVFSILPEDIKKIFGGTQFFFGIGDAQAATIEWE